MPALHGSRSLVVGGAHRLGKAIALDLAQAGADVAISYHTSAHAAEATRAEIEALGVRTGAFAAEAGDTAQMAALIDTAAAALDGLEVVVYCPSAGFEPVRPEDVTEELWDVALESTGKGFMFAAQAAHRHMTAAGGGVIFSTDDCRGTYEKLLAAGVEFTQEPTERFYGIDCGLRDPFGNPIRITQPPDGPVVIPSADEFRAEA